MAVSSEEITPIEFDGMSHAFALTDRNEVYVDHCS